MGAGTLNLSKAVYIRTSDDSRTVHGATAWDTATHWPLQRALKPEPANKSPTARMMGRRSRPTTSLDRCAFSIPETRAMLHDNLQAEYESLKKEKDVQRDVEKQLRADLRKLQVKCKTRKTMMDQVL